jgi:hypothetical protein
MAFSLMTGIALAAAPPEPMPKKKMPEGEGAQEPAGDTATMEGMEEALVDPDGDISIYDVLCDLLECEGYELGEGTTSDNFQERMYTALMSKRKEGNMGNTNQPPNGQPNNLPPNPAVPNAGKPPVIQEQPPLYMSLEDAQKINDPVQKGLALSLVATQNRLAALEKNAIEAAKARRQARLERICKFLPVSARDQLIAQCAEAKFSLADDGTVKDPINVMLDVLESGMRQIPEYLTSQATEIQMQSHPVEYTGGVSEERAQATADTLLRRAPNVAPLAQRPEGPATFVPIQGQPAPLVK